MAHRETYYVTMDLNRHIPVYCGSSWAHAAMSSLADRHQILRPQWPDINYSIQVILNCAPEVGSCHGGNHHDTFEYVHENGIPEETCQLYRAVDDECTPANVCRDCTPPVGNSAYCKPVLGYTRHSVSEYGRVQGELNMMAEIYERGPIACSINSTGLHTYTGGIFIQSINRYGSCRQRRWLGCADWCQVLDSEKLVGNLLGERMVQNHTGGKFRTHRGKMFLGCS
ncbi:hypothetical protein R1flu_003576 [Riccia fluitans]|uniref:Peptidase C1A papain C-terminal domain-containing protein n=1 Tax=Riccia fluitans TaxID=41844 RepID=A0ABD1Y9R8_9MARC